MIFWITKVIHVWESSKHSLLFYLFALKNQLLVKPNVVNIETEVWGVALWKWSCGLCLIMILCRNEGVLKRFLHPSVHKTTETTDSEDKGILSAISCSGKEKARLAEELVSLKEISHSSNNLSDHQPGWEWSAEKEGPVVDGTTSRPGRLRCANPWPSI